MKKLLFLAALAVRAYALPAPVLYYLDLDSGPNTGGRNNNGSVVCIFGNYFGASRGSSTVTFGGGAVAEYLAWGDWNIGNNVSNPGSRVCVSLGSSAVTGNVIVTVGGVPSNALTFTVRSTTIYYAGVTTDIGGSPGTASDSNSGAFDTPVATIRACKNKVVALSGSICYVRSSVPPQTGTEANSAAVYLNGTGSAGAPNVLIAWQTDPDMPIVGDYTNSAFYNFDNAAHPHDYWTLIGFWGKGSSSSFRFFFGQTHLRFVNNLLECPAGKGGTGCMVIEHQQNDAPQDQSYKIYGNEIRNTGCGFGMTGGTDDAATLPQQTLQIPCAASAVYTSTMSSSDGITITRTGGSAISTSSINPGDHVFVKTNGTDYEERIIDTVTTTQITVTVAFTITSFSGRNWYTQQHISDKLYHTTYFGTDTNGYDFGWNYLHNNSALHGINIHSTTESGGQVALTSCTTASPSVCTITAPFQTGTPVDGQRIDIVLSSQINASFYVQRISDLQFSLYTDHALTTPYSPALTSTGGFASRSGFGMFNFLGHDNWITYQNGAAISLANPDASKGPINFYNNVISNVGTGPRLNGDQPQNLGGFYFLMTPDDDNEQLWGTGTTEIYNNSMYNAGSYANGSNFMAGFNYAKSGGPAPGQIVNLRNNIIYQPAGIAFAMETSSGDWTRITGDDNIFFGTNSASIPPNPTGNVTADPLFISFTDFHLQPTSPARFTGLTITGRLYDFSGLSVPQGPGPNIGAYEIENPPAVGDPTAVIGVSAIAGPNVVFH